MTFPLHGYCTAQAGAYSRKFAEASGGRGSAGRGCRRPACVPAQRRLGDGEGGDELASPAAEGGEVARNGRDGAGRSAESTQALRGSLWPISLVLSPHRSPLRCCRLASSLTIRRRCARRALPTGRERAHRDTPRTSHRRWYACPERSRQGEPGARFRHGLRRNNAGRHRPPARGRW